MKTYGQCVCYMQDSFSQCQRHQSSVTSYGIKYYDPQSNISWAIPFNSCTPPMDDQQGKFNPWTQLSDNHRPWTDLN